MLQSNGDGLLHRSAYCNTRFEGSFATHRWIFTSPCQLRRNTGLNGCRQGGECDFGSGRCDKRGCEEKLRELNLVALFTLPFGSRIDFQVLKKGRYDYESIKAQERTTVKRKTSVVVKEGRSWGMECKLLLLRDRRPP